MSLSAQDLKNFETSAFAFCSFVVCFFSLFLSFFQMSIQSNKVNFISITAEKQKDRIELAESILKKNKVEWKYYFDIKEEFPKKLNASGYPLQILVDSNGKIIDRKLGDDILKSLTAKKDVIRLQHNLFIHSQSLNKIIKSMREIIKEDGFIEIFNFKQRFDLSRKYLVCYLDYLDNFSDIKKIENRRVFS